MPSLRGKPFAVIPARDDEKPSKAIEAVQRNVFDTFDQLEDARRGLLVSTVANVPASIVLAEQMVVIYSGKGGDVMRLPPAALRGGGRGQVLFVANQGTGTVTLAPVGRDTLNGATTVTTNGTAVFWSDGSTKWHELPAYVLPPAVVMSTRSLISTADITLDGSASATKDLSADRTIGLANAGAGAGTIGTAGITSITLDAKGRVTAAATATYVIAARQVLAGAGLSGGGALSADVTISMPNTGPGAGTIGSHSAIPISVGLDAQGRVTGVTTQSTAVTLSNDLTARDHIGRRIVANTGTAIVAGDFALSAGWGTTRSLSAVTSGTRDTRGTFQVTSNGTGQAANPTITLTFKDGTYPAAPFALVMRNGGSQTAVDNSWQPTATTLVITFLGTPVAGQLYGYTFMVMG